MYHRYMTRLGSDKPICPAVDKTKWSTIIADRIASVFGMLEEIPKICANTYRLID